jgi:predicted HTH transcriptional regulator
MNINELKKQVSLSEDSRRQFKADITNTDELPTKAGIDKLDKLRFRDFLRDIYHQEFPEDPQSLTRLLQNMNLAADNGMLNLAGVLLFAEKPEWIKPQFIVKAIRYPGNIIQLGLVPRMTSEVFRQHFYIFPGSEEVGCTQGDECQQPQHGYRSMIFTK